MEGTRRRNERWERDLWNTAIFVCLGVDRFVRTQDPDDLQEFQTHLAAEQYRVERKLGQLESRQSRRKKHVAARVGRKPGLRRQRGGHDKQVVRGEAILQQKRHVLRMGADALAWEVLRRDPRLLRPMYVEGRSHRLPHGIGFDAPLQVVADLNSTGDFFAIYNDLTRCVKLGDVLVVRSDRARPLLPVTMELKSRWLGEDRSEAEIDFLSLHSNHPEFVALFDDVCLALGLKERKGDPPTGRAQRQVDEMVERASLIMRLRGRLAEQLHGTHADHWSSVRSVLEKAYSVGSSFDIPEPGIVYAGLRIAGEADPKAVLLRLIERITRFQPTSSSSVATSEDMKTGEELSPFVLPIPLWPIPGDLRNAILAGRLFFATAVSSSAWRNAFSQEGVLLEEEDSGWTVHFGEERAHFDVLEVQKLSLGVVVGGVSPRAVATAVRDALAAEAY